MTSSTPTARGTPQPATQAECPQCGAWTLTIRHCKLICEACGYVESCEDNFVAPPADEDL